MPDVEIGFFMLCAAINLLIWWHELHQSKTNIKAPDFVLGKYLRDVNRS